MRKVRIEASRLRQRCRNALNPFEIESRPTASPRFQRVIAAANCAPIALRTSWTFSEESALDGTKLKMRSSLAVPQLQRIDSRHMLKFRSVGWQPNDPKSNATARRWDYFGILVKECLATETLRVMYQSNVLKRRLLRKNGGTNAEYPCSSFRLAPT